MIVDVDNKNKLNSNYSVIKTVSPDASLIVKLHEENLQHAEPILSGALTPYEAFKEGFEQAIASYLQLGREHQMLQHVAEIPVSKTEETQHIEDLVKSLLRDFDSVKFIKKESKYLAIANGKLYHFSTLLERVDFNKIEINANDLQAYHQLLEADRLFEKPYISSLGRRPEENDFNILDTENNCRMLTFAEKEAINIYTGHFYQAMNHLMRGNVGEAIECCYVPSMFTAKEKINHAIKETLLHVAVAVSGLNKLPDFVPPPGPDGREQKYLYRAEYRLPEDVLKKRKWAVLSGGGITHEMGFLSTAYAKPSEGFFNEDTQSGVMIKNLKGKKITPLSRYGNAEREVLLPPTQLRWLQYQDIATDIFKNSMTLFMAEPVSVPSELAIDYKPLAQDGWCVKTIDVNESVV